jgi:glycosidase
MKKYFLRTALYSLLGVSLAACSVHQDEANAQKGEKMMVYQVMTRLFGNNNLENKVNGSIMENGVGKFDDFTKTALDSIHALGINTMWYTGVIAHASKTDYSKYGIPKNHPGVVKGNAGSPYAIRDYYDVDPDLAVDVHQRMKEFEALVQRTHEAKMSVILDFIPNHVAREYKSYHLPEGVKGLGDQDDHTKAFDIQNNFYYLPNEAFKPQFNAEGYQENPAKVTGNDVFSSSPSKGDWYETIKLNYGVDYEKNRIKHFTSVPDTWKKMTDILLFWKSKGVDGFRVDMAEMVPVEFFEYAIAKVKKKYPNTVFIAEIYNPKAYKSYIQTGGFDYLYDKVGLYDTLKSVIKGHSPATAIAENAHKLKEVQAHLLNFLENHDEQRIASPNFAGDAEGGIPMTMVSALYTSSPFMIYFGQVLGEPAKGSMGFSADDGRTSIFDYCAVPSVVKWRSGGFYNGMQLTDKQLKLRKQYKQLLHLANHESCLASGATYDLTADNIKNLSFNSERCFAFARYTSKEVVLVVVNFSREKQTIQLLLNEAFLKKVGLRERPTQGQDLLANSVVDLKYNQQKLKLELMPWRGMILRLKP